MTHTTYSYKQHGSQRYVFTSIGKTTIVKFVDFSATRTPNLYNIGFGDLLPDRTIDDTVNSNNGDMVKVLATVVQIIKGFTNQFPEIKLIFFGSTQGRINLYRRILKTYYTDFSKDFTITAFVNNELTYQEVIFIPHSPHIYYAFFVKRIF